MKRLVKILAPLVLGLLVAVPLVFAQGTATEGTPIGEVDTAAGETVFTTNCMACHQATGMGIPSAFPPLAGHFPELVAVEGGRDYVIDVVLWGLQGPIQVGDATYNSVMTSWAAVLNDQQIADVLNYAAVAWENAAKLPEGFTAFAPEEVAAQRETQMTPTEVHAEREALALE